MLVICTAISDDSIECQGEKAIIVGSGQDSTFTWLSVSHAFEVVDASSTTFRSEHIFRVRAEIDTRFFTRHYFWTGSGSVDEPEPLLVCEDDVWGFPQHRVHGPVIIEGTSRILVIDLGRTLVAGQEEVIHFCHRLKDLNHTFDPYIGHLSRPGMKKLDLSVALPEALSENVTFQERMLDTGSAIHVEQLHPMCIKNGTCKFDKQVTKLASENRGYRICW